MATSAWTADHPLVRWILRSPYAFDFFQLLNLVERACPDAVPLGCQNARRETVRLRPALSLSFPASDLHNADWQDDSADGVDRLRITTTFLGLYGSDSPLATHFTEALLSETEEDERVRAFLDLFHHRLLSLLYRVWKKYRYYITFSPEGDDQISQMIRGFLGIGTARTAEGLKVSPVRLFRYVGLLSQRPRSAAGLAGVLSDYFQNVPFEIKQCIGRWLPIQESDRNRFGQFNCTLGEDFLLGESIFDRSGKFRISLGPVGFDHYVRFLPPGDEAAELRDVAKFYCSDPLEFDLEVILRGDEVPETPVGAEGMLGRLAWTSWLKSQPMEDQPIVFSKASGED
ncbi:MAG: type VI secretion system baseplate subunit TssG [Planctomycetota bacterium]